ncbi:MAG TPA: LLM class flavin-dependent oxidoreductase [Methylomirabilota bacterium]|jgi:alkanesulfonate monooxygenase SsuD/methylene tetrahydromethanopterin reductase-like flavin-dependent oxidoreductase (luciferase family)|nr:LLM class flavin-dependent oxidoreductase [Methylomirabilota bacterium]
MAERLGLAIIPGVGWSARDTQAVSREAEEAGFDAIFAAEVNNDVMATAQLMGAATRNITVGTWIANIYLRHSSDTLHARASQLTSVGARQTG